MNASNLRVKSVMRLRRSSKLKSTVGSCVSGLSEYDIVPFCDCDGWNEDVLVEKDAGGIEVAMVRRKKEYY